MKREVGFYWVKMNMNDEWIICKWDGENWLYFGYEGNVYPYEVNDEQIKLK